MATFIVLGNFTEQGIRSTQESLKRTEAFSAEEFGKILGKMP